MSTSVERTFEFVRAEDADDPHAFRTGVQEYIVRRSDGSFEPVRVQWDQSLLDELVALREAGRDPELPRRLGDRLRQWFGEALGLDALAADVQRDQPVRLRVVSSAAELYTLPWELLTLPGSGAHLGAVADVEIAYRWPAVACQPPEAARPEGGRILLAWSRAFGPVGERLIADALAQAAQAGLLAWDPASDEHPEMSLPGLVERLERETAAGSAPAVLHLLCHGAPTGDGYGLGLDDGRGGRVVVDSGALARALAPFARRVRLVVLMACDSGNPGAPGTRLGSAAQELHRAGFESVVASRLPLSGAAALEFTAELYRNLLVETCSVEHAFSVARARLLRLPGSLDWASVQLYQHALPGSDRRPIVFRPYRGLLSFDNRHARFFYGRDPERDEMLADFDALRAAGKPRFLVVAGASGTGKSSVVLAGVRPALHARGWTSVVLRPGNAPRAALALALAKQPEGRPFVVVVDQLEELFTHVARPEATAFARALWALGRRPDGLTAVIVTIRVDFLGRCDELTLDDAHVRLDQIAYDETHRVFVGRMSTARLAEAITRPAARIGLRFEEGLCARLIREVGDEPGALPLLQYALDSLWNQRTGDLMTHAALDAIGGVGGAIARHADAAVAALDDAARRQARRTLVRLIHYGGDITTETRRRVALAELRPQHSTEAFDRAVEALVGARLLQRDEDGQTLEVSHEALIRRWPALWDWYQQDRDRLARQGELRELVSDAMQYGVLLLGRALARARELAREFEDELWPEARRLIEQSVRSKRIKYWRRFAVGVVLFGLTAAFAAIKYRDSNLKESQRQQLADALARSRLSAAERLLSEEPWAAAVLLREVTRTELPRWRQLAFAVTQEPLPIRQLPGARAPAVFTAAGDRLFTDHTDGSVRAWSMDHDAAESLRAPIPGRLIALAVDEAGGPPHLAALREDSLELWRIDGPPALVDVAPGVRGTAMHHTRGRIAVQSADGTTDLWRADEAGLTPVADALPCRLLTPGTLRCRGELGDELRTHESPHRGRPLGPLAELRELPSGGLSALLAGEHVAWDGDAFVRTGLRPAEAGGFVDLDPRGALVHRLRHGDDGEARGELCRLGAAETCAALPPTCRIEHASKDSVTAACRDAWRIFARATLTLRQTVRRPLWAAGSTVDAGGSRLAIYAETGGAWLWQLDGWTRARDPSTPSTLAAKLQPSRARLATIEAAGPDAAELVVRDLTPDAMPERRRVPLPSLPGDLRPELAVDGDTVAWIAQRAPGIVTSQWIDLAPQPRIVTREAPGELTHPALAVHAHARLLLRAERATVVVDEFSGPEPVRLGVAHTARPCSRVTALAFAPDGGSAAVGCAEGDLAVLALPSLRWLAYLGAPGEPSDGHAVTRLAFAPSGRQFVAARSNGTIDRIDGVRERRLTRTTLPRIHRPAIGGLEWSEYGLASVDTEGLAAIWLAPDGDDPQPLSTRSPGSQPYIAIGLTPDRRLLAATLHGSLWEGHAITDIDGLIALLEQWTIYCPTAAERVAWLGESAEEAEERAQACLDSPAARAADPRTPRG